MEKFIKPFKSRFKSKNINEIFKQLPVEKERQVIPITYKNQIKGSISLLCVTTLVLSSSYTLKYLETHVNNLYPTECYSVLVDGEEVAKVRNPELIEETINKVENDLEKYSDLDLLIESDFEVVESLAKDNEITSEENLYSLIKPEVKYSLLAYSININGESVGVVDSEYKAKDVIEEVKDYFTRNYDENTLIEVKTAEDVTIEQIKVENTRIQEPDDIINYIIKGTDEEQTYIVQEGDSYWSIAEYYNMSLDDLITANPSSNPELIQIGDELSLTVPKPFINVQVKRRVVQEEEIDYDTAYEYVSYMYNDESVVSKPGKYGISKIDAIVTEQNGIQIAKEILNEEVISEPVNEVVLTGTQDPPPKQGTGYFINPLPASYISSRFGPRSIGYHMGIDMAKAEGSSIKAADGGTVIFAGWSGTYGYMIEIDHGGGFTTRYGHCSELYVSKGEKVYQDKIIAAVGNTGYSTGPHLHFEVRKYGTPVNPSSYIGVQYR